MARFSSATVLAALLCATPAMAQTTAMRADGWVSEGGRILREGEARPANYMVHPATRADWLNECDNRLRAANTRRATNSGFGDACLAWLDYYERIGATRNGYDFAYAIPVSVTTIETPCPCPPPPAPVRPHRRPVVHDKRIKL